MMMFMGRGSRRSSRGSSVGGVAYDPYQCAATCAAQQGYCPKPAAAFLQLQEMPLAPQPPKAPLPPLSSLPPLLPPLPPQADGMGVRHLPSQQRHLLSAPACAHGVCPRLRE